MSQVQTTQSRGIKRSLFTSAAGLALLFKASFAADTAKVSQNETQDKCRILALSGGASHGAWEAGLLWGLLHYGDPADFTWDVISGVSAGSLNTSMIVTWPKGEEVEMTEWMSDKWAEVTNQDVWREWPDATPLQAALSKPSLLDDHYAVDFVKQCLNEREEAGITDYQRKFAMGSVDASTGQYIQLDQSNVPTFEELPHAAMASGSIPVVFTPTSYRDWTLIDGGSAWNVNIDGAINECLANYVTSHEDIIVDVFIASWSTGKLEPVERPVSKSVVNNLTTAHMIHKYYMNLNSISAEKRAYPDVDYRYYMYDESRCPDPSELDFNNSTTWCYQMQGREDAKTLLDIGQDKIHATLNDWLNHEQIRNENWSFRSYLDQLFAF